MLFFLADLFEWVDDTEEFLLLISYLDCPEFRAEDAAMDPPTVGRVSKDMFLPAPNIMPPREASGSLLISRLCGSLPLNEPAGAWEMVTLKCSPVGGLWACGVESSEQQSSSSSSSSSAGAYFHIMVNSAR